MSIMLLFWTTQHVVGNAFLVAIWSLPAYAIIIGLFGMEKEQVSILLFQNKLVLYLGRISLELFLIHQLVIRYVETIAIKLNLMSSFMYIVAFLITIIVATVLHELKLRRMPVG